MLHLTVWVLFWRNFCVCFPSTIEELAPESSRILSVKSLALPSLLFAFYSSTGVLCIFFCFLVRFIRWLILYNSFSASVPISDTSASLLRGLQALYNSSLRLRSLKLKCSCSSSGPYSFAALAFKCFIYLRTSFNALVTRSFRSSPLVRHFLAPCKLTLPAPPPRAVNQVYS